MLKLLLYDIFGSHVCVRICANDRPSPQAIPPGLHHIRQNKATAIATDVDDGTGPDEELPEPSKEGAVAVGKDEQSKHLANGVSEPVEEEFSRTGWAPRIGWPVDSTLAGESLLDHTTWVESQLPDHLYGGRFHQPNRNNAVSLHG